jgi:hypothetical protein
MNVRRYLVLLLLVILPAVGGCVGQVGPGALAPSLEPGMQRVLVTPAAAEVLLLESFPVQVKLEISGELPNPCARLGWSVMPGDDQGRIQVALYVDEPTEAACIQVVAPYSQSIPLGSFERGSYGVFVNGQQVGEFVLP